ncbi:hypothetical protein IQ229_00710 [Nostoc cf. edaphicum LEGE 07299]|uniref:Uncharacterized protein n=1 Tax=Nostoc cf. edaphicum LEGE 07299 TaxID=2777974 RepID=A0ABR9TT00_9NOSO|nr:hypothetical protein [Nostoc edaphicum]MBE9103521.1 hypothetical protein [Nostoc cf. edaphicum LEGE 07299]
MIDVKTAVNAAYEYLKSLQDIMGSSLPDLRLEEVELSEDQSFWLITLGFDKPEKSLSNIFTTSRTSERVYKLFKVNSQTGEVEAMKIREV